MYVGVEMIRLFQTPLLKYDDNIYDHTSNKATNVKTSELADELGQVNYILSDKTGTLTKNSMVLEQISVGDKIYTIEQIKKYFSLKSGHVNISLCEEEGNYSKDSIFLESPVNKLTSFSQADEVLFQQVLKDNEMDSTMINNEHQIIDFFRLVNICNSIVLDYSQKSKEIIYQSTSIDELALAKGSTEIGMDIKDKSISRIEVNFFNSMYYLLIKNTLRYGRYWLYYHLILRGRE